jgi:hypothetical protein
MKKRLFYFQIIAIALLFLSCENVDTGIAQDRPCSEKNPFCHEISGLKWTDLSKESLDWEQSVSYCEQIGGRLPDISELRTLIINCENTETEGECNLKSDCLKNSECLNEPCSGCDMDMGFSGKYSVFKDTDWLLSSSVSEENDSTVFGVLFHSAAVSQHPKEFEPGFPVRCVK